MLVGFGKHLDRSVAWLVLKDPDYVRWALGEADPGHRMLQLQREVRNLIGIFNAKPFVRRCQGTECGNVAAGATAYRNSVDLMFWCTACDPYQKGASAGKLQRIMYYQDVLFLGRTHCGGRKDVCERLVRQMAQAKGLPERVGEAEAEAFFGT
jgi:hypothetical protein